MALNTANGLAEALARAGFADMRVIEEETDRLAGLISIGDVNRWLAETHRAEAQHLRQYIAGGFSG